MPVAQIEEQIVQGIGIGGVQIPGRLVGKKQGRVVDQSAGHGHALLLPAAELAWQMLGSALQSQFLKSGHGSGFGLGLRLATYEGGQHGIFQSVELGKKLMELENKANVRIPKTGQRLVF